MVPDGILVGRSSRPASGSERMKLSQLTCVGWCANMPSEAFSEGGSEAATPLSQSRSRVVQNARIGGLGPLWDGWDG